MKRIPSLEEKKPTPPSRRALGGDVINVKPDRILDYQQLSELRGQPFVRDRQVSINPDLSLRVVVDDTSTALPAIFAWMDENGYSVESAGEYNPPFDDVFVMLLKQEAAAKESEKSNA